MGVCGNMSLPLTVDLTALNIAQQLPRPNPNWISVVEMVSILFFLLPIDRLDVLRLAVALRVDLASHGGFCDAISKRLVDTWGDTSPWTARDSPQTMSRVQSVT